MVSRRLAISGLLVLAAGGAAGAALPSHWRSSAWQMLTDPRPTPPMRAAATLGFDSEWSRKLVEAGLSQIGRTVSYDTSYEKIGYPGGDVPIERGVCTDVVIRAYRDGLGFDLQKAVHEDMSASFAAYPKKWGLKRPDANIDHRRVPNLQTFFSRRGAGLAVSADPRNYRPGDLVTMMLPGNLPHIAIVTAHAGTDGERPLIVHNIGAGTRLDDVLFAYAVTGHYRFAPA